MVFVPLVFVRRIVSLFIFALVSVAGAHAFAQGSTQPGGKELYDQIRAFSLAATPVTVNGLTLTRDRVRMTFNGMFYFAAPVAGRVTGAIFIGNGIFSAEVPPSEFEVENV